MKLNELKSTEGSKTSAKRVGRGVGSGFGKTAGRGQKGQNSRSGGGVRIGFEGGQTPLYRRLPKRGFSNFNHEEKYATINVDKLETLKAGTKVDIEFLKANKMLTTKLDTLKVLGDGTLTKKLIVSANKFSKGAINAIENAGGKIEVI